MDNGILQGDLGVSTSKTCPMEEIDVADTFCIVKRETEEELLNHLNNTRPTIKFTMELERESQVPILRCTTQRRGEDDMLGSPVHTRMTPTDIDFTMVHTTQFASEEGPSRAYMAELENLPKETDHLHWVFSNNEYPLPSTHLASNFQGFIWQREERGED